MNGENVVINVTLTRDGYTVSNAEHAGSYTATASTSNTNYQIGNTAKTKTFTIAKKAITINWGDTNGTVYFVYNDRPYYPTCSVTGIISGDDVQVVLSPESITGTTTVWASLTGEDANNYDITNESMKFVAQSI
jgi:hypothetical protein